MTIANAILFNARRGVRSVLNPFFSMLGGDLAAQLTFEHLESHLWAGQFHNEGNLVNLSLPTAHQTVSLYDATLRETCKILPNGTFQQITYEPLLTRTYDENDTNPALLDHDTPMAHHKDGLGRLIQVDEITHLDDDGRPLENLQCWTTRYQYNLNDRLTQITDSQNNITTFAYDGLKRNLYIHDPDRGVKRFLYDDASNLLESINANNQRITYTYDCINRILTQQYHDEKPVPPWRSLVPIQEDGQQKVSTNSIIYHYDKPFPNLAQGDNSMQTACNVKGQLAWVEDLSGEEHISYDSRGRVEWIVKRIPHPQFLYAFAVNNTNRDKILLVSYKTTYNYDSGDRVTRVIYPDNDEVSYRYNQRRLLDQIVGDASALTPNGLIIQHIRYQPSNQEADIYYGNGLRTTFAHDPCLRLVRLLAVYCKTSVSQQLVNLQYSYDGVSNINMIEDLRPTAVMPEGHLQRNTQLFEYDDLYRLTRAQYSYHAPGQPVRNDGEINYRYDRIGNMLAQSSTLTNHIEHGMPVADLGEMNSGGVAGRWHRVGRASTDPPGPHALTSIRNSAIAGRQYAYDANGNVVVFNGLTNTWDFKDRLVAAENQEMRASYIYDYTGQRTIKGVEYKPASDYALRHRESRITTLYVNKYFEIRDHDAPVKYVWNGSTLVARITGSICQNLRVQRFRVCPGWNLVSLAVSATNVLSQLNSPHTSGNETHVEIVTSAFRWQPLTRDWVPVLASETLAADTVLWLNASTWATISLTGFTSAATKRSILAGGDFVPSPGFEKWNPLPALRNLPATAICLFDANNARWLSHRPAPLDLLSNLPGYISPGTALFFNTPLPAELSLPNSASQIHYYQLDHLGSAILITDAESTVLADTKYYPFGRKASQYEAGPNLYEYGFVSTELDSESIFNYIKARYYDSLIGRFLSVEPLAAGPSIASVNPQALNPYAYCLNNPLRMVDSSGLAPKPASSVKALADRVRMRSFAYNVNLRQKLIEQKALLVNQAISLLEPGQQDTAIARASLNQIAGVGKRVSDADMEIRKEWAGAFTEEVSENVFEKGLKTRGVGAVAGLVLDIPQIAIDAAQGKDVSEDVIWSAGGAIGSLVSGPCGLAMTAASIAASGLQDIYAIDSASARLEYALHENEQEKIILRNMIRDVEYEIHEVDKRLELLRSK